MGRKSFWIALALVLAPFWLSARAWAEPGEDRAEEGVFTLGEIVVRGKIDGVEATGTLSEVKAEDIRDSGARNLMEAVDLLPGVDVFTGGDGVPRISIRGFRPRHVVLLLDGIPLNSAYDQQFDPTVIPTEHIARIKLTSGPNSVLYGQGGLGGVINIITKKGARGLSGMVGGEAGTGASYLGKASVSAAQEKWDFFLSGSAYTRDAFPLSDDFTPTSEQGPGDRNNSDQKRYNFFGNAGYTVSDDLNLGVTFNYVEGEYGIPGGIYSPPDLFSPNPKYQRIDHFEGLSLQVAGEYQPSEIFGLRAWGFRNQLVEHDHRYDDRDFSSFDDPLVGDSFKLGSRTTIQGVSLQPKFTFGDVAGLTLGFSAEKNEWESRGDVKDQFGGWPPVFSYRHVDSEQGFAVYSVKVEYECMPCSRMGLVAGYGHYWQERDERSEDESTCLFGAHFDLTDRLRLKAAYQKNIRFPDLRQFYDEVSGNEDLKTERTTHYTLGLDWELPWKTHILLNGFHSIARNFIEKDKVETGSFANFEKYEFTGGEIAAEMRYFDHLTLRAGYSYLRTRDLSGSGRDELQYRPEDRITLEAKYVFDFGLSVYASMVQVADLYAYSKSAVAPGVFLKEKLDDYTLVSVKLNQSLWNDRLNLYVRGDNLLDEDYEQSYALPQAGRMLFGGMELRY